MSPSTALASVSRSLRTTLLAEMAIPQLYVTLLGIAATGPEPRVNLFLHRVDEHPHLRNADQRLAPGTADRLLSPPMSLILRYFMTAHAKPHDQVGDADSQAILGEAMRVFHQHPVVPATHLEDDLVDASEQLRVVPVPITDEEIGRIWSTTNRPYQLAVQYEVSVVQIDPTGRPRPLPPRVRRVGVPQVRAPYTPPVLRSLAPLSGPPGTVLTILGDDLTGWRLTVTVDGDEIVSERELTSDEAEVTLPSALAPGFHRIRVDVARLARASWFFEVV